MNLLLDTHTFIWWDSDAGRLSATAFALCSDPNNQLFVSVASLWEMQIKHQIGKLVLRLPLSDIVTQQQAINQIKLLPIESDHIFGLDSLPTTHKDPFDRLLVAQSISEDIAIVSGDIIFRSYPVRVLW